MEYGLIGAGLLVFFIMTFFVAKSQKNNGLIDIVWGLGFVVSSLMSYFVGNPTGTVPRVMTLLVAIWGLRLSFYLARRNLGKPEDFRYADMRAKWDPRTFHIRMFIQIYLLQLVLNYIINLTTIVTNLEDQSSWGLLATLGVIVWIIGFIFESVGDAQLRKFRTVPANKGKLITTGLWRYTRHPNYFGEATQWWGLYLMAVNEGRFLLLIVSPLVITFFLLYVSGVPLLERKFAGRPDWEVYKAKTSRFVPWFPKKA